jgi:hypothetical protein
MPTEVDPRPGEVTWCEDFAYCLSRLRVIPRLNFLAYWILLTHTALWFTSLPEPSGVQMAYAGLIAGLLPPVAAIYSGAMTMGVNARPAPAGTRKEE